MKLRFGKSNPFIVGDHTFSPWVSLLVLISLLTMNPFPAGAQLSPSTAGAIEIEEGGELWIEGSASVVDYQCHAEQLSGNGNIENTAAPRENVKKHGAVSITVSIPVSSLECGKRGMNRDMYEALKAEKYSHISYELLDAVLAKEDSVAAAGNESEGSNSNVIDQAEGNWMNIKTTGVLEIAGVKDTTVVYVKGQVLNDNRFKVKGSKQINMKTYDIKPPTALMGLIRASSDLTVHFNVTVKLSEQ